MSSRRATLGFALALAATSCRGNYPEKVDDVLDSPSGAGADGGGAAGPVDRATCVPQVPAAALLRLTQAQYLASVAAALPGATLPALDLPADGAAGPFASNETLLAGDLAASQYQAAAWAIAGAAAPAVARGLACGGAPIAPACAAGALGQVGAALFRRPLTGDEVATYLGLGASYLESGDLDSALTQALAAMLQSPSFLYRPEFGTPADASGRVALSDLELAGRLALFLTGGPPDASLLAAAAAGELVPAASRRVHVDALVASDAFAGQVAAWVRAWLALSGLAAATKDATLFSAYTPEVEAALAAEVEALTRQVIGGPAPTLDALLTTPALPQAAALAAYYRVDGLDANDQVARLSAQRPGVLTRGAFLAAHGHSNGQTPAVLRGKVVRENLLCQSMPTPPPDIPALPTVATAGQSARQIFAAHEAAPTCAACHTLMDPIGLGFEAYDNAGAWRTLENGVAVDASGQLLSTPASDGPFADAAGLVARLAASRDVGTCVVRQMLRFALARMDTEVDACTLARVQADFDAGGRSLKALMVSIAMSDAVAFLSAPGAGGS